jgi:hypothetical protein
MTTALERLRELRRMRQAESSSDVSDRRVCSDTYPRTNDWPGEWREEWSERAAVREYDGLQNRTIAEAEAYWEILPRMVAAQESVSFKVDILYR